MVQFCCLAGDGEDGRIRMSLSRHRRKPITFVYRMYFPRRHLCLTQIDELASKSKEFIAATSKREQLEYLLEKAEGSQVASTDLQEQVLLSDQILT